MFQDFRREMTTFLKKVKEKIEKKLHPEYISIINKSNLHTKHQSFDSNKYYFKIVIKSKKLKNMGKIDAHKVIFSILKEEIKNKIHALEIEIIQNFRYKVRSKTF